VLSNLPYLSKKTTPVQRATLWLLFCSIIIRFTEGNEGLGGWSGMERGERQREGEAGVWGKVLLLCHVPHLGLAYAHDPGRCLLCLAVAYVSRTAIGQSLSTVMLPSG
jgi:hypothetical protein